MLRDKYCSVILKQELCRGMYSTVQRKRNTKDEDHVIRSGIATEQSIRSSSGSNVALPNQVEAREQQQVLSRKTDIEQEYTRHIVGIGMHPSCANTLERI